MTAGESLLDFVERASALYAEGESAAALNLCIDGLSSYPNEARGRLLLARIFYEQGRIPFAVREVRELCSEHPDVKALSRLLEALAPGAASVAQSVGSASTVAEAEFDIDLLDAEEKK